MILWVAGLAAGAVAGFAAGYMVGTRKVRAEAQKQVDRAIQNEQETRATLLGTIGGGLGHELKTPLSTLQVNLQLLHEEWSSPQTDREQRSRRKIEALQRSAQKIEQIVRAFVRFAKEAKPKPEATEINDFVREILEKDLPEILNARNQMGEIRVSYDLESGLPSVALDRALLRQVLTNLLSNAVESIEGQGTVTLATRTAGDRVEITITDTGSGVPDDLRDRIWDVYFTTKPSGIGLGLPIARRIVEAHGGTIRLESADGGTRFVISLPVKRG